MEPILPESHLSGSLNPWFSVWTKPRATIRQIVDTNPSQAVFTLVLLAGAGEVVMSVGFKSPLITAIAAGAGMGFGVLGLYFFGWIYRWVGSWFGGVAQTTETRAAIAWSHVPSLYLFGIWLILFLVFQMIPSSAKIFGAVFFVPNVVISVWSFILLCKMAGEAHHFSAWKGLGTVFIPSAILLVPVAIIGLLAAIAIPNFIRARDAALAKQTTFAQTMQPVSQVPSQDQPLTQPNEALLPDLSEPLGVQDFHLKTSDLVRGKVVFEGDSYYRVETEAGNQEIVPKQDILGAPEEEETPLLAPS